MEHALTRSGRPPLEGVMRTALARLLTLPIRPLLGLPIVRRVGYHARRIGRGLDLHFFRRLLVVLVGFVLLAAGAVTVLEEPKRSLSGLGDSFYWAVTTVIGSGDASYVTSAGGFVVGWLLAFFGVAIVAAFTAAFVGFVIDFLLKEGQGMGAAGYEDHIVVCGWNSTARELIEELKGDEFTSRIVLLHESDKSPVGLGVYFVRGDCTNAEDLERAGVREAAAAISSPPTRATRPTCAPSSRSSRSSPSRPTCARSSRSTTRSTSSTSSEPDRTRSS